jgi:hypothetical protein
MKILERAQADGLAGAGGADGADQPVGLVLQPHRAVNGGGWPWCGRSGAAPWLRARRRFVQAASGPERGFNPSVVLLARAGQDLSRYGVRWSHLGIAYRQPDAASPGGSVWRVLHKLNQCGSAEAAVYRQGLGDFFLDDLWRFEAAWVVPTPEVQQQLLALLLDGRMSVPRALALHHKPYSIVSYAWSQTYQQSNQWAIETLALAMEPSIGAPGEPMVAAPPARPGLAAVQGLCTGGAHA